ncbi:hypothetical protein [Ravibacter arvi]|uniref:hypothetical protein n=1 Tax=Ravibacter arvi TaxID=2051041 RepID=UPI0031F09F09
MQNLRKASVDVAISVYGKPYQTAVTLLTLLRHSDFWIDKIYFLEERKQPEPSDFNFIYKVLGERVLRYKPMFWFGYKPPRRKLLSFAPYRRSVRYQYAWEKTDKKYLLLVHNDVYFKGDLVFEYLKYIDDYAGVGKIGQCWNCPAYAAQLCNGDNYQNFKPTADEIFRLASLHPGARTKIYSQVVDIEQPWPLPECRLNEYVGMINMEHARNVTLPRGKITPFGIHNPVDTGVKWFQQMNQVGYNFYNVDYDPFATHSWVSLKNSGNNSLSDRGLYRHEESIALKCLQEEFGIFP